MAKWQKIAKWQNKLSCHWISKQFIWTKEKSVIPICGCMIEKNKCNPVFCTWFWWLGRCYKKQKQKSKHENKPQLSDSRRTHFQILPVRLQAGAYN